MVSERIHPSGGGARALEQGVRRRPLSRHHHDANQGRRQGALGRLLDRLRRVVVALVQRGVRRRLRLRDDRRQEPRGTRRTLRTWRRRSSARTCPASATRARRRWRRTSSTLGWLTTVGWDAMLTDDGAVFFEGNVAAYRTPRRMFIARSPPPASSSKSSAARAARCRPERPCPRRAAASTRSGRLTCERAVVSCARESVWMVCVLESKRSLRAATRDRAPRSSRSHLGERRVHTRARGAAAAAAAATTATPPRCGADHRRRRHLRRRRHCRSRFYCSPRCCSFGRSASSSRCASARAREAGRRCAGENDGGARLGRRTPPRWCGSSRA